MDKQHPEVLIENARQACVKAVAGGAELFFAAKSAIRIEYVLKLPDAGEPLGFAMAIQKHLEGENKLTPWERKREALRWQTKNSSPDFDVRCALIAAVELLDQSQPITPSTALETMASNVARQLTAQDQALGRH